MWFRTAQIIGGVIAPGLEAMTNFLYQRTALLPRLSLKEPHRAVGKSTVEAMRSAPSSVTVDWFGRFWRESKRSSFRAKSCRRRVGGYARLIASQLPEVAAIHPHLTLEGLRIVGNLN